MTVLHRYGACPAAQVMDQLPEAPSYSAVRALLRILVDKGHVRHHQEGPRYVYQPVQASGEAAEQAMKHTVSTFFKGSVSDAVAALLDASESSLEDAELVRLQKLIEAQRKEAK